MDGRGRYEAVGQPGGAPRGTGMRMEAARITRTLACGIFAMRGNLGAAARVVNGGGRHMTGPGGPGIA